MTLFDEIHEFQKDYKRLNKKYRSLPEDFERLKQALLVSPIPSDKHTTVLTEQGPYQIIKVRMACRALKQSSLRVIYAYEEQKATFTFIELYFKGDKPSQDDERIRSFLKERLSQD
ncbi:hypothetical protein KJ996_02790 [Patescibacteria group bacterium]|nr:hypothetical protein [Patescibacteria group bacterium]